MRFRVVGVLAISALVALTACSSSSKSSSGRGPTTTTPKSFHVQTADGQVSLSLTGQLPPNWPSGFPIPNGATPAGSGSFVNGGSGALVGVYTTSESPSDAFNFYKTDASLTVTSSKSAGAGSAYVGEIKLGGAYPGGSVTIVSYNGSTYIVVVLQPASNTTTTT